MSNLVVTIGPQAVLGLQALLMDKNGEGAFERLQEQIASQSMEKGNASCDSSRENPLLFRHEGGSE